MSVLMYQAGALQDVVQDSITVTGWRPGGLGLVLGDEPAREPTTSQPGTLRLGIDVQRGSIQPGHPFFGHQDWGATSWLADGTRRRDEGDAFIVPVGGVFSMGVPNWVRYRSGHSFVTYEGTANDTTNSGGAGDVPGADQAIDQMNWSVAA